MDRKYLLQRDGKDYVLYPGLLNAAHDRGLHQISTTLVQIPTAENGQVAIATATVELVDGNGVVRRFSGIGDASPANVNRMMAAHLLRMAETRAKARALRDAVNIGEGLADDPATDLAEDDPRAMAAAAEQDVREASVRESPPAKPTKDAPPREWFVYLHWYAKKLGVTELPAIRPDDSDDVIQDANHHLYEAITEAQTAAQAAQAAAPMTPTAGQPHRLRAAGTNGREVASARRN
jgi:hypothetical protein